MLKKVFLLTLLLPICSSSFTQSSATKQETLEWIGGKVISVNSFGGAIEGVDRGTRMYVERYSIRASDCVILFGGSYSMWYTEIYFGNITAMNIIDSGKLSLTSSAGDLYEQKFEERVYSDLYWYTEKGKSLTIDFGDEGMCKRVMKALEHLCSLCGCNYVGDKF